VHPLDDLRRVDGETVHPPFQPGPPEIVDARVLGLEAGSHRAVENEHALAQRIKEWRSICGRHRDDVIRERLRDTLANRPISFEETLFGTTPTPSR
jgi:hypothetical protein